MFFQPQIPWNSPGYLFIIIETKATTGNGYIERVNVGWAFLNEGKALCPEERHLR